MKVKNKILFYFFVFFLLIFFCTSCDEKNTESLITATVTINLRTSDGGSVSGAIVTLDNHKSGRIYQQVATRTDVSFSDVEYGTYTLIINHDGYRRYEYSPLSVQMRTINHTARLQYEGGGDLFAIVSINLTSNDGGSVNGATVILENSNDIDSYSMTSSSSLVTFSGVIYGTYSLTIGHAGYQEYSFSPLSVLSSNVSHSATLISTGGIGLNATVTINLSTDNGGSANGAMVVLENHNGVNTYVLSANTQVVTFYEVVFGTYTLMINHNDYQLFIYEPFSVQTNNVAYTANLVAIVDLTASVNLNLSTDDGGSVFGAIVVLENHSGINSYQETATGSNVSFADVDFGTYTVMINHSGYHSYLHSHLTVQESIVEHTVILVADGSSGLLATVNINFVTEDDNSDFEATVVLVNNYGEEKTYQQSTITPEVVFTDVEYGTYTLIINSLGYKIYVYSPLFVHTNEVNYTANLISENDDE
ncbi:MAG: carboxypeptidase-like regulatory domain-containing protein [Candidatus Cloacimonetes bacterium]|nr:carboxypeptidase-like regulatory domain-containing protein [Candidatus Cloacimonadota bacterium]